MRVLESPITWIVVAAVLLVVAVVLIIVSGVRRRRARRAAAAAASPPPALESRRADPEATQATGAPAPVSNLAATAETAAAARYADPTTDPLDVDAVRAGLASGHAPAGEPSERPDVGPEHRPRHAAADTADAGTAQAGTVDARSAAEDGADSATTDDTPGDPTPPGAESEGLPEPAGAAEAAKDRLLGVLLRDPQAAVAALVAGGGGDAGADVGEHAVTALLRAGLSPAQVARLVGVDESRLATVVARGLGLLPDTRTARRFPAGPQGDPQVDPQVDAAATAENRTEDPGRSWANAASSAGSTTPTTG